MWNNTVALVSGGLIALEHACDAQSVPDFIGGMMGVGLLVWIVIRQSREIDKLRERNRALADKCTGCDLARTANGVLIEHAKNHEDCN